MSAFDRMSPLMSLVGIAISSGFFVCLGASSLAAQCPFPPEGSDRVAARLELVEVRSYALPNGRSLAGAAISPDGDLLLTWFRDGGDLLLFDPKISGPARVTNLRPVVGGSFLDAKTAVIVHDDGTASEVSKDGWVDGTDWFLGVAEVNIAVRSRDGWWLLSPGPEDGSALHFVPDRAKRLEPLVMHLPSTVNATFLSSVEDDALVGVRDPPHVAWRIDPAGQIVSSIQPPQELFEPSFLGGSPNEVARTWRMVSGIGVDPGILQVIVDVTSDARVIATYDTDGSILSCRLVEAPLGFVTANAPSRLIAALMTLERSEILLYSWLWRSSKPRQVSPRERPP